MSKDIITWIHGYLASKPSKSILMSVSCIYERTYELAMSVEHKSKVEKYMKGSDNRRVLQIGLSAELPLNNDIVTFLRNEPSHLCEVSIESIYDELRKMNFSTLTFIPEYKAYIFKPGVAKRTREYIFIN